MSIAAGTFDKTENEGRDSTYRRAVFLSHSHSDKRFARNLARELETRDICVWVDEAEINVGESLIQKLRAGIDEVDFVVAVLSRASVSSEWVSKELDIAMTQEIELKRVKVLPLVQEECNLPGFLKRKLFADFRKRSNRKRALDGLTRAIRDF